MIVNYIWKMSFLRIGRKIQELYYNLFFFECVYRYLDLKAIEKQSIWVLRKWWSRISSVILSAWLSALLFSHSILSNSLWPHGLQHANLLCPSLPPRVCSNLCPLSWWCHPTVSSSVAPFSSCPQSFPASESFPLSRLLSGDQSIGSSASVLPVNIQGWFPLGLTSLFSLLSKGLSRDFQFMEKINSGPKALISKGVRVRESLSQIIWGVKVLIFVQNVKFEWSEQNLVKNYEILSLMEQLTWPPPLSPPHGKSWPHALTFPQQKNTFWVLISLGLRT